MLADRWTPGGDCPDVRAWLLGQRGRLDLIGRQEVEIQAVHGGGAPKSGIQLIGAHEALPHTDTWHPAWSALWVLQAGPGHALKIADRKSRGYTAVRKPARKATETVPMVVGDVVLFHAHRVHWMPAAEDGSLFVAACFEFEEQPDRETVEAQIRETVASRRAHVGGFHAVG